MTKPVHFDQDQCTLCREHFDEDQCTLCRAGIHIVAIGVGLKNTTELRQIATPPADDNAVQLANFDGLKAITERIFNDLSSSVCPRTPTSLTIAYRAY